MFAAPGGPQKRHRIDSGVAVNDPVGTPVYDPAMVTLIAASANLARAADKSSTRAPEDRGAGAGGGVIGLSVGGTTFVVGRSTLARAAYFRSMFAAEMSGAGLDRDICTGHVFIDRSATSFQRVLGVLRGHPNAGFGLSRAHMAMLVADLDFYGVSEELRPVCVRRYAAVTPSDDHDVLQIPYAHGQGVRPVFAPGAGVSPDGARMRSAFLVCPTSEQHMLTGLHAITFRIRLATYIGVGVIPDSLTCFDHEFHQHPDSAVLYMNGRLFSTLPAHRQEELRCPYGPGSQVTLALDLDRRTLRFFVDDAPVRVLRLTPTLRRCRFAAILKDRSAVSIEPLRQGLNLDPVPCEEYQGAASPVPLLFDPAMGAADSDDSSSVAEFTPHNL